jgi:trimeric autotransporter adhesin
MPTKYSFPLRKIIFGTFLALLVIFTFGFTASAGAATTDIVAINSGGPAVSNSGGGDASFAADEYFSGGGTDTSANTIVTAGVVNAAPMAVYQSERAGTFTYTIPGLTAGSEYTVLLHFAEFYWTAAGKRVFNVAINGTTVLSNFDIYATVGANKALVEEFTATANSSGQIVIAYTNGSADQPKSSGIEIQGASSSCSTLPSAPTGLTATTSSSSAINLSWATVTPPANCTISSYNIYRSATSGFAPSASNLISSGTSSNSYANTGLLASTTYYYIVEAVDADGTSPASTQASAETSAASCTTIPSAPTGLTATASSSSAIGLSWTAVTPPGNCSISSYSVYGSTTSGFTPSANNLITSGLTSTSYINNGLSASTTYYYVVEAIDVDGTSAASGQASATTQAAASGTEIVAINSGGPAVSNSGGGDASFVADEDVAGGGTDTSGNNIVTAGVTNAAPMAVYQSERAGAFTYTIPGLTAGTQYTVLLHFAEFYWTAAGERLFNVAINGTTVLNNFDIYATVGANKALVEQFTATANSSGQIVIAYTNGTADQAKSSGIEIRSASSTCSTVPSAPTGLIATASSSNSIGLSWTAVTPPANCSVSSYSIYRSTTSGFTPSSNNLISSGAVTGTTYSDTGLAAATTYYYVVEAVDADGTSTASSQASAETTTAASCSAVPSAPTGLTATASSSSTIGLTWTAVTPPTNCVVNSYSVYGSATSGFTPSASNLIASGVSSTSYSNTGLSASTTHYYVVEAIDADGASAASTQESATTLAASGTEIVAINSGGLAVSNLGGGDASFVADEYYNGGGAASSTNPVTTTGVTNAAPEAVYQTERNGAFNYTVPGLAPGAQYTVLLHFAETYWTAAGERIFNVAINGATVLSNFDIYATAGANTALVEQFTTTANSSGQIVVSYTDGSVDQPKSSGIEIRGTSSSCTIGPSAPPTGLTALASSPSIIGLSWTAVTPPPNCAITYNLYGSTTSGFTPSSSNLIATGLTNATYSNTGLAASTTYYYVVEAVDADGTSAASAQASAETNSATSCIAIPSTAPTNLTATASTSSAIDLSWVPITPPTNCTAITYNIYSSTTSGFAPSPSNQIAVNLTGTTFFNTSLPASSTYYYVVQAVDEDGTSTAVSMQSSATTLAPPTVLTAAASSANEIDLTFPASTAAAPVQYLIFRSTTPTFTPTSTNQIGTTKSNFFQDVVASASTTYFYIVQASNPAGITTVGGPVGATTLALGTNAPFWDASNMPATPSGDVMTFKILNRTNGQYPDDQVFWSITVGGVTTTSSIAAQPYFQMPANSSGRMEFYLGPQGASSPYSDFIEFTIGPTSFNGDTTRVDAFGIKLAFQLTCADGTDIAVGENSATFAENRATTFQRYLNAVPSNFQQLAQLNAPYQIISPGGGGFDTGGAYADYYTAYIAEIWSSNGLTIPLAGANGDGLGAYPDLSAAIYRHTAAPGTFNPNGTLISESMWGNPSNFYQTAPASYYAQFFHANAINGQQYAFPYDDAGGYSADVGCSNPTTLLVAVGW